MGWQKKGEGSDNAMHTYSFLLPRPLIQLKCDILIRGLDKDACC